MNRGRERERERERERAYAYGGGEGGRGRLQRVPELESEWERERDAAIKDLSVTFTTNLCNRWLLNPGSLQRRYFHSVLKIGPGSLSQ